MDVIKPGRQTRKRPSTRAKGKKDFAKIASKTNTRGEIHCWWKEALGQSKADLSFF